MEYSHLQETGHTGPSAVETEVLVNQMSFLGQVAEAAPTLNTHREHQ